MSTDSNPSELILAVPGPEQMRAFPKSWIRQAIAKGELKASQLIWSPAHNAWKQLRELPHLNPTRMLAPLPTAPARVEPTAKVPKPKVAVAAANGVANGSHGPKVAQPGSVVAKSAVKAANNISTTAKAATPVQRAPTSSASSDLGSTLPASRDSRLDKTLFGLRVAAVFSLVLFCLLFGGNYLLVHAPFVAAMEGNGYGSVQVYATLGGFYQSSVLTIHLVPGKEINTDTLPKTIVMLAKSTPRPPFGGDYFSVISLSPGWTGGHLFNGVEWRKLGDMESATPISQKLAIMRAIMDPSGKPEIDTESNETELSQREQNIWNQFEATYVH